MHAHEASKRSTFHVQAVKGCDEPFERMSCPWCPWDVHSQFLEGLWKSLGRNGSWFREELRKKQQGEWDHFVHVHEADLQTAVSSVVCRTIQLSVEIRKHKFQSKLLTLDDLNGDSFFEFGFNLLSASFDVVVGFVRHGERWIFRVRLKRFVVRFLVGKKLWVFVWTLCFSSLDNVHTNFYRIFRKANYPASDATILEKIRIFNVGYCFRISLSKGVIIKKSSGQY